MGPLIGRTISDEDVTFAIRMINRGTGHWTDLLLLIEDCLNGSVRHIRAHAITEPSQSHEHRPD